MGGHIAGSDMNGFGRCCMYSDMWETDGVMLRDGSEEDGKIRRKCVEGEDTACDDGDRDKDRQHVTCFVYYLILVVKYNLFLDI